MTGPFGLKEAMRYFQKDQRALFEVADLVGLGKIPQEKRNPLHIQTRGIGELIRHLIELGMKEIYIGVGGTASNDGGIGIAAGLGYRFYDKNGKELPACGQTLLEFESISDSELYRIPEDVKISHFSRCRESSMWPPRSDLYIWKTKGLGTCIV